MNGLRDFVAGGYPLPWNVITMAGLSDFVSGGYPLPQTPVYFPSVNGSLPKAPPMPMANIGARNGKAAGISGCGCGGSCGGCSGLGAITGCTTCSASMLSDTLIPQASLPTFLQGDTYWPGIPTLYLAGGIVLLAAVFLGAKKGRR